MSKPTRTDRIGRRQAIKLSAGAGLAAAFSGSASTLRGASVADGPLVKITLDVREVNGRPAYNGVTPGPAIVAHPGDNLDVHLINNLPALNDDCTDNHNRFHGLNTTNLHTHGLHVSPFLDSTGQFDADNVFLKVVPKDQVVGCEDENFRRHDARYRFEIPANHPPGTFWYHAHKHGATARQVGAGLSGPLIIKDPPGAMPPYIAHATEKVFMVMNQGFVLVDPAGGGTFEPTIKMRPGEVQRWRLINAKTQQNSFVHLRTDAPELEIYQIAYDGLTLPRRVRIDQNDVAPPWENPAAIGPGNRTDLLVRVPPHATNRSFAVKFLQGLQELLRLDDAFMSVLPLAVEIAGEPVADQWSDDDRLPGPGLEPFSEESLPTRTVSFTRRFSIDGERYSGKVRQSMAFGSAEEWTIRNNTGGAHVHHIHVNPFFVTHINGVELAPNDPLRRWQDTIALPPGNRRTPGSITYRTRFERFKGKFVIHCHILRHEDLGMMQAVEVV